MPLAASRCKRSTTVSGGAKRKARNCLPQIFLIVISTTYVVVGAFVVTSAYVTADDRCFVLPSAVCLLEVPIPITRSQCTHSNGLFKVTPFIEVQIRRGRVVGGNSLNAHFSAFAAESWRCWLFSECDLAALTDGAQHPFLKVERKHFRAMGVDPLLIGSLDEVLPALDDTVQRIDATRPHQPDAMPAPVADLHAYGQNFRTGPGSDESRVLSRLEQLAVPRAGGVVTHSYEPRVILHCLAFENCLKASARLSDALIAASGVLFNSDPDGPFAQAVSATDLPSEGRLREASVRLQLFSMLYQQLQFPDFVFWRYLNPDSSPQLGWDWLVMREDIWQFGRDLFGCAEQIVSADLNKHYIGRTSSLSTLARGRSGLIKKSHNISTQHKLVSDSEQSYDLLRSQVYGITSDMGTEKGVCDISTMRPIIGRGENKFDVSAGMQYPNALYMVEHLHVIFSALEHGVEKVDGMKAWLKKINTLERFLSDKSLRRLFIANCMLGHPDAHLFLNFSHVSIDWRWESLVKGLDQLIPLLPLLVEFYDKDKMCASDAGKSEAVLLTEVAEVLPEEFFLEISEAVRVQGTLLERTAHRLEGCECHREIWTSRASFKRKQQIMLQRHGYKHCFMKGRQAVWFQIDGLPALCNQLMQCTSDLLQRRLSGMGPDERHRLVRKMSALGEGIREEVMDKLAFHFELPYNSVRIYLGELVPSRLEEARGYADECCDAYDKCVADGRRNRLHRVAHRIFDPNNECRQQLDKFRTSDLALKAYPVAWMVILQYVLISLVGRRVEAVHGTIKRLGLMARNAGPPFISAALGLTDHLQQLRVDRRFFDLCCQRWRSPVLLDELLHLVHTPTELKLMSKQQKLTAVYQCSIEAEFRDMASERVHQQDWLDNTRHTRVAGPPDSPMPWKLCIAYLKAKFETGFVFSLDLASFRAACQALDSIAANADPVADVFTFIHGDERPVAFDASWVAGAVFFEVLNVHPERRSHVRMHHSDYDTDVVHVVRREVMKADVPSQRVLLLHKTDSQESLHLRTLVNNFSEVLPSLWGWGHSSFGSAQAFRRPDRSDTFLPALEDCVSFPVASNILTQRPSSLCNERAPESNVLALASHLPNERHSVQVLGDLERMQVGEHVGGVPFEMLPVGDIVQVEALVAVGAIKTSRDDFGSLVIRTEPAWTRYMPVQIVAEAFFVARSSKDPLVSSKLDVIVSLLRSGWQRSDVVPTPFEHGAPQVFLLDLRKATSYYVCLALSADLFEKRIERIPHDKDDMYYQCLLRLQGPALRQFLSGELPRAGWRLALKTCEEYVPVCNVPEELPDAAPPPGQHADEQEPPLPPLLLALMDTPLEHRRASVQGRAGIVKVYFDHCTGSTMRQRCYSNCQGGHENCFQWRQADDFVTRADILNYFYCWATEHSHFVDRLDHMMWRPSSVDLACLGELQIADF
jgi:hypothetical protein